MLKPLSRSTISSHYSSRTAHKKPSFVKSVIFSNSEPKRGYTRTYGGAYFNRNHKIIQFFKGIADAFRSR